mmetsp:Transcript_15046/g.18151  ORF Transcript_15046/g.18151 Transcript_15046/m.18151 type:complete len:331 (+) Transcript_15046:595-1587(+)
MRCLHLNANLQGLVQEISNLFEVSACETTRGHGRGTNTHTSRGESRCITKHSILVQSDVAQLAHALHLVTRDGRRPQVPKDQVVLSATGDQLVAVSVQPACKSGSVCPHLLRVDNELWGVCLLECNGKGTDLVVVGSSLESGEHCGIDLVFVVVLLAVPLTAAEEDHSGARSTERLVGCGGDDVAELEGRSSLLGGNKARDVCHIAHQKATDLVGNGAETSIVPLPGVCRPSADDHFGAEVEGLLFQLVVVDVSGLGAHLVGKRLEVDRGSRNLHSLGCVEAVGQVTSGGQVKTHDTVVRVEQASVHSEVGRAAGVRLDVDAPLCGVASV